MSSQSAEFGHARIIRDIDNPRDMACLKERILGGRDSRGEGSKGMISHKLAEGRNVRSRMNSSKIHHGQLREEEEERHRDSYIILHLLLCDISDETPMGDSFSDTSDTPSQPHIR